MTNIAGQPDDYYHYRVFSEGSINREQAINMLVNSRADLSDCFGICFISHYGLIEYVHFKEMSTAELVKLAPLRKYKPPCKP